MELSSQGCLRLNVLLQNPVQAIRIDEAALTLYGLSGERETAIVLHPTGSPRHYLQSLRRLLATRALGAPQAYALYIDRWLALAELPAGRLDRLLLLLAEPDAVAVVADAETRARLWNRGRGMPPGASVSWRRCPRRSRTRRRPGPTTRPPPQAAGGRNNELAGASCCGAAHQPGADVPGALRGAAAPAPRRPDLGGPLSEAIGRYFRAIGLPHGATTLAQVLETARGPCRRPRAAGRSRWPRHGGRRAPDPPARLI